MDEVVNGVVEKENNIIEGSGQQRCYKIFNQVVKRRRLKNLISLRSLKMASEKSLHLMLLDLITVRLNILNINQKIKEIEEMIRKKIEPRKKEIALVETETKIAVVKPNQRIEEHTEDSMPVLPEQNINEENYEIDDANEAQICYHDLAPTEYPYPWREIKEDFGKSSDSDDTVPDLYPDSPPSLTSNDSLIARTARKCK